MTKEELLQLREDVSKFADRIYDHLTYLNQTNFLSHIYDLQIAIDERIANVPDTNEVRTSPRVFHSD